MVMIAPSNNTAWGGGGGEARTDRRIQNDISFVTCVPSWPVPAVRWERETSRVLVLTEEWRDGERRTSSVQSAGSPHMVVGVGGDQPSPVPG